MGKPLPESDWDVDDVTGALSSTRSSAKNWKRGGTALPFPVRSTAQLAWEPVGVVGAIIP